MVEFIVEETLFSFVPLKVLIIPDLLLINDWFCCGIYFFLKVISSNLNLYMITLNLLLINIVDEQY